MYRIHVTSRTQIDWYVTYVVCMWHDSFWLHVTHIMSLIQMCWSVTQFVSMWHDYVYVYVCVYVCLYCDTIRFHVTWLILCLCLCLCLSILWHNSFPCDMRERAGKMSGNELCHRTHCKTSVTHIMSLIQMCWSVTQFVSMWHDSFCRLWERQKRRQHLTSVFICDIHR